MWFCFPDQGCQEECNDINVVACNRVVGMAVNCICEVNFYWTMGQCRGKCFSGQDARDW